MIGKCNVLSRKLYFGLDRIYKIRYRKGENFSEECILGSFSCRWRWLWLPLASLNLLRKSPLPIHSIFEKILKPIFSVLIFLKIEGLTIIPLVELYHWISKVYDVPYNCIWIWRECALVTIYIPVCYTPWTVSPPLCPSAMLPSLGASQLWTEITTNWELK